MKHVKNLTINKKLTLIIMLSGGSALLLACLAFVLYDSINFKYDMVQDLQMLADMIGTNSAAALTFGDADDAHEILQALRANPHIVEGCIYDIDGSVFCTYHAGSETPVFEPLKSLAAGYEFKDGYLDLYREIIFDNTRLGMVFLRSDMQAYSDRVFKYIMMIGGILLLSSLVAFLMAARLRGLITGPILNLARMAKIVSDEQDFSVRAEKQTQDELGFLTERFNDMLEQIQDREEALKAARDKLELQAKKLRKELARRKRLQAELARAQRLESAGRIAGQIAHDFNNLLGPLAAYPTLIREELPPGHPVLEMVEEMQHSANKIAEINQQLLALGRRGHYTMERIDLNELVEKVLGGQHLPQKVQVRKELTQPLLPIKGGAAQLTRALTNLIINAIEAMHFDGVLTITSKNIYLEEPLWGYKKVKRGEYVLLEISDNGDGIKPEHLNKIFDPFFTTKTMDRMRGSGLGLSIVHGIVEDHNGYITVKSTVGKGTTFGLYFPVSRVSQNDVAVTVEKISGGHESILIVDDDPIQRKVTSQLLRRLGYQIHCVDSGERAVEYVKQEPQDLVILDMVMDGIDGTETYRRILEFQPRQKAIVLSGYAMSKRVREALTLGAGSFVSKPISLEALARAVRTVLDKNGN